jgi:hypothetical protein
MSAFDRLAPWWGLLVAPSAFLGLLSVAYALVPFACREQMHALVHLAPATEVVICTIGVALSGAALARHRTSAGAPPARPFMAAISLATALLFLVASGAQWYVAAALSPCVA